RAPCSGIVLSRPPRRAAAASFGHFIREQTMRDMFSLAHAFTARWEGGLAEHPADPGGLTKYGVSMRWVQDLAREAREECLRLRRSCDGCVRPAAGDCAWQALDLDMDGDVDADDVRACTRAQAAALFRRHFWDRLACGRLPLPLAVTLYDGAVNMGPARAVRQLQSAMNLVGEAELEHWNPIAEDGLMGPKTRELAEALNGVDLAFRAARQSLRRREAFYRDLAVRRPSMKVFLQGWRNRVADLAAYLGELERGSF
ncbi:glycoside hydrolase family 108 protein, partial [uncultured Desulfovibrio sp.]|uniref:glycoside hydrolase family 108 protein n=1 Tax=uncultured Desulfovibrio sp. TaxID=167968 RepID=UPI00345D6345